MLTKLPSRLMKMPVNKIHNERGNDFFVTGDAVGEPFCGSVDWFWIGCLCARVDDLCWRKGTFRVTSTGEESLSLALTPPCACSWDAGAADTRGADCFKYRSKNAVTLVVYITGSVT